MRNDTRIQLHSSASPAQIRDLLTKIVKLWCANTVYYINPTNTSWNCIASIANPNKFNAAGALLWLNVGDIIKNTESDMAVRGLPL
jgi:hypothetical protein